jgi:formate hydrogenlyase subunit 3/multisubunit Na+/H+ antiporter MnhD subunit
MVSKDQAIGGVIFIICAVVAILYFITLVYPNWITNTGWPGGSDPSGSVRFWMIAIPVFVAFIGIMCIGAWIGWTMATTPPPKPIEEVTSEISEEKEEAKVEEKTEAEETPAPPPAEEEKKPERRRKTEK